MQRYYSRHHRAEVLKEKPDYNPIFDAIVVGNGLFRDRVTGSAFAQTYAGTNRTRISAGVLEAVAANTPVIDYVGGVPVLRIEPAADYLFLNSATPTTQDIDVLAVKHTVCLVGTGSATISAGTATIAAGGAATDGTPFTVDVTGAGTITVTIAGSPTRVWLTNTAMAHSYVVTAGSAVNRTTEANTTTLAIPAAVSAALAATGTLVVDWMPSWSKVAFSAITNFGILAAITNSSSLVFNSVVGGDIFSFDGTVQAQSQKTYVANTLTRIALQWPSSANKFKIGADVDGAGIAYGPEYAFDGAFTVDANLIPGYTLYAPMWIKSIRLYNNLLTDAQVNALP